MGLDHYTEISEDEFSEQYEGLIRGDIELYGTDSVFRVYEGDLSIEGDFDLDAELAKADTPHFGMVVRGNLEVGGVLKQDEELVGGNMLFVLGDLHAYSINKGAGAFVVQGDVRVDDTILAMEGDEGAFDVGGGVTAKTICLFEGHWAPFEVSSGTLMHSRFQDAHLQYRDLEEVLPSGVAIRDLRARVNARQPILAER